MGSLHKPLLRRHPCFLLAVVALAPGISIVASLLPMIPAFQMIEGRPAPVFPVSVVRNLEKIVHPRWPTPLEATKRLVGTFVVILNITWCSLQSPGRRRPRPGDCPNLWPILRKMGSCSRSRYWPRHRVDGRRGGGQKPLFPELSSRQTR
jgi:hypothetical protein